MTFLLLLLWSIFFFDFLTAEQTSTTSSSNLLLSKLGEKLGLNNDGDIDLSIPKKLEVSLAHEVDHRSLAATSVLGSLVHALSGDIEQLVDVARGGEVAVLELMELTHTHLTEVTRVIFIKESSVVVLSSGVTATTGVFAVFADTAVTHLDVAALLACFVEAGGHGLL